MDEFVGEQAAALRGGGPVLAGPKEHVVPDGQRLGITGHDHPLRRGVCVDAHMSEVMIELTLKIFSDGLVDPRSFA
jgi:hypothetical protein